MNIGTDRFRNIASGIQSIVLAFAVIIGGGWTLYSFIKLNEIDRREAELKQLQLSLRERAKLDIHLTSVQLPSEEDGHRYVAVTVEIENKGNLPEVFLWENSGLAVAHVTVNDDGKEVVDQRHNTKYSRIDVEPISEAILPGHSRRFPFLIRLNKAGIYHLEFYASVSPYERQESTRDHAFAKSEAETYQWTEATYIHVK